MAVKNEQLKIDPYTSTVPMVQMPAEAAAGPGVQPSGPLQGQFGRKGTGALAIGDAILKGFMQGHAYREQKQMATAQANINAADAAVGSSYQQYQDVLTKAGGNQNDPNAQAAYGAYLDAFNKSKAVKAQYAIGDTGESGKGKGSKGAKGEKKSAWSNIGDFLKANPHIVPQMALASMQPQAPGLSAQSQTELANLESAQLKESEAQRDFKNKETYQQGYPVFNRLTPEEVEKLPPDSKKQYDDWLGAKAALSPMNQRFTGQTRLYKFPNGDMKWIHPEEADLYPGAQAVPTGTGLKPGTEAYFQTQYAQENGIDPGEIPPSVSKYLHDDWAWKQQGGQQTVSSSTMDESGNRTTTTRKSSPPPPRPPRGVSPVNESRAVTPPPSVQASSSSEAPTGSPSAEGEVVAPPPAARSARTPEEVRSSGESTSEAPRRRKAEKIPPPPARVSPPTASVRTAPPPSYSGRGGGGTWQTGQATRAAIKAQQEGYKRAEDAFNENLRKAASKKYPADATPEDIKRDQDNLKNIALNQLNSDKRAVQNQYDETVRSLGGTPGGGQQKGAGKKSEESIPKEAISHLKKGSITTFGNGQQWTLDENGKPKRVK